MLNREMADRPSNEALTRGQDVKKILFVLFLSFLFIPSAHAQSGEDEESASGKPASYISAGYHFLSRDYEFEPVNRDGTRNEDFDTERFPVGVYGEYGYNVFGKFYILALLNYNRRSDPETDRNITRTLNIFDLKAGIKYHWDPRNTSKLSFYMATHAGAEIYKIFLPGVNDPEYRRNTLRNFVINLGPGMYFKLNSSVWVDISAGYRKVLYGEENDTIKSNDLYGRIGLVYAFGYR